MSGSGGPYHDAVQPLDDPEGSAGRGWCHYDAARSYVTVYVAQCGSHPAIGGRGPNAVKDDPTQFEQPRALAAVEADGYPNCAMYS